MIKIASFYPFSNFLRVTQEFHEDKVFVRAKSLTFEQKSEFEYGNVGEISDSYNLSNSQMSFSFGLLILIGATLIGFHRQISAVPVLLQGVQILYICGILLFITSFTWNRHIILSDANDNSLAQIKQTRHNRNLILQAVEIIKSKTKNIQEISSANPFPEAKPVFEHTYYDISSVEKTTDKFYENEIIGFEKSFSKKRAYKINYNILNGKVYNGKAGIDVVGMALSIIIFTLSIMTGLYWGFNIISKMVFLYTCYTFIAIFVIAWLLTFIKREFFGFTTKMETSNIGLTSTKPTRKKSKRL